MEPGHPAGLTEVIVRSPQDPIIAWRYWQAMPGEAVLRSVTQKQWRWPPGRPLVASCAGGGHTAPSEGCACGIYGTADLTSLRDHGLCLAPDRALVVGQVALWGKAVPDGKGFRAQYALPRLLSVVRGSVPEELLAPVIDGLAIYGVPVTTTTTAEAVGDVSGAVLAFQAMSTRAMSTQAMSTPASRHRG